MGRLRIATFTGVDDHTDLDRLGRILERYRFAEAGVLVSLKRSGVNPRFPSLELLPKLCQLPKRLSVHICDELARSCVADPTAVMSSRLSERVRFAKYCSKFHPQSCQENGILYAKVLKSRCKPSPHRSLLM